jgi:hypothetical protein
MFIMYLSNSNTKYLYAQSINFQFFDFFVKNKPYCQKWIYCNV